MHYPLSSSSVFVVNCNKVGLERNNEALVNEFCKQYKLLIVPIYIHPMFFVTLTKG